MHGKNIAITFSGVGIFHSPYRSLIMLLTMRYILQFRFQKCFQIRSFFWSVFSRIQNEYGEIRSYLDTFHVVFTSQAFTCQNYAKLFKWRIVGLSLVTEVTVCNFSSYLCPKIQIWLNQNTPQKTPEDTSVH